MVRRLSEVRSEVLWIASKRETQGVVAPQEIGERLGVNVPARRSALGARRIGVRWRERGSADHARRTAGRLEQRCSAESVWRAGVRRTAIGLCQCASVRKADAQR